MVVKSALKPRYYGKGKASSPDPIDVHVGSRVKLRRGLMNMSQTDLASVLGITFQQVQKYERGSNRVSASRLFHLSQILDVAVEFFFEGYNYKRPGHAYGFAEAKQEDFTWLEEEEGDLMERKETLELVRTYYQVQDETVRKNFLKMLKSLVASQG
jgi:transcriptional regulator with XRE-family HTH domain